MCLGVLCLSVSGCIQFECECLGAFGLLGCAFGRYWRVLRCVSFKCVWVCSRVLLGVFFGVFGLCVFRNV